MYLMLTAFERAEENKAIDKKRSEPCFIKTSFIKLRFIEYLLYPKHGSRQIWDVLGSPVVKTTLSLQGHGFNSRLED